MNYATQAARSKLIQEAKKPMHSIHTAPKEREVSGVVRRNTVALFRDLESKAPHIIGPLKESTELRQAQGLGESLTTAEAIAWVQRAQKVVSDRAATIDNHDEKQGFLELSGFLKESIPLPQATEEDVQNGLRLLQQKITVQDGDSKHLSDLKNHLVTEITAVL